MQDIQHVVIDNLHFMMDGSYAPDKGTPDRFKQQEEICALFRKLASQRNVHVTVVIHPNSVSCLYKFTFHKRVLYMLMLINWRTQNLKNLLSKI